MSIKRMTAIWDQSGHGGTEKLTLLAIADFADDDGFAWPTTVTLAKKASISRRQMLRVIQSLRKSGELIVLPRTGPRSNCYIIAIGNSRSGIKRSLIRGGQFGVGKSVLAPIRKLLREAKDGELPIPPPEASGDNLSPTPSGDTGDTATTPSGDTDDTPSGDTDDTRSVIADPSVQPDPPESADDGASEGDQGDAAWLEKSRVVDPEDGHEMSPEAKAEMGAPGAGADLHPTGPPGEPEWIVAWRQKLRVGYVYGFGLSHVTTWVQRFADPMHANLTPPTKRGDAADWHGGALSFLYKCHEDLAAHHDGSRPPTKLVLERAMWCLDYFYWRKDQGHDYYQHEITRPGSLSNRTVAILARDLRDLQGHFDLDVATMPTTQHLEQTFNRKGGKIARRKRVDPEDAREREERQRRYDGGIPDDLQTENVLAWADEQRTAAGDKRGQVVAAELPDVPGDGSPETEPTD